MPEQAPIISDVGYDDDEPDMVLLINDIGAPICELRMPPVVATLLVWSFMATGVGDC